MHSYQQAHFNLISTQITAERESIANRLNEITTYYEFFKSVLTNSELLAGIRNQMDLHNVTLEFVNSYHLHYLSNLYYKIDSKPITITCNTLWTILTELESKCKNDITNLTI